MVSVPETRPFLETERPKKISLRDGKDDIEGKNDAPGVDYLIFESTYLFTFF